MFKKRIFLFSGIVLFLLAAAIIIYRDAWGLRTALYLDTKIHTIENLSEGQVIQRTAEPYTSVGISGRVGLLSKQVRISFVEEEPGKAIEEKWADLCNPPRLTEFSCSVKIPGNTRVSLNLESIRDYRRILIPNPLHITAGDVFVIAGQSNAAGECNTLFTCRSDSIRCGQLINDRLVWKKADDPQVPGNKGSVWPMVGNLLSDSLKIHIGFINIARGGTSVKEWLPGTKNFSTLAGVISNLPGGKCKAVLWHQGESDFRMSREEYIAAMSAIISELQKQTGASIPWMAAKTSYVYGQTAPAIRSAQEELWNKGIALQGPDTDSLGSDCRESDNLHFNRKGTEQAARLWFEKIVKVFY